MHWGNLTDAQKASFIVDQATSIRKPTFSVWIAGISDVTDYIYTLDTDRAIESLRGYGSAKIGIAVLTASNENGIFMADGESQVEARAQIKIWSGFNRRNIPIFSGIVDAIKPDVSSDIVTVICSDYMGYYLDPIESGHQGGALPANNTIKLIMESYATEYLLSSDIASTDETNETVDNTAVDLTTKLSALENFANLIFCVPYFDEGGTLILKEREYTNPTTWVYNNNNVVDCEFLADTEIINDIEIEYKDTFVLKKKDTGSIDSYGLRTRYYNRPNFNSVLVSSYTLGSTTEDLDYNLEAFKITSHADSSTLESVGISLKKTNAHGYISCSVYTDSGGVPGSLIAGSLNLSSGNFSEAFAWEFFRFEEPQDISPSTDYWIVIDTSSVSSGSVEAQRSAVTATAKHAHYDGGWVAENDKQIKHKIRGSRDAQRVADDAIRFYKDPHARIKITAPLAPSLQLMDEVLVDVIKPFIVRGKYVIEERRIIQTPELSTSIDKLRKVG